MNEVELYHPQFPSNVVPAKGLEKSNVAKIKDDINREDRGFFDWLTQRREVLRAERSTHRFKLDQAAKADNAAFEAAMKVQIAVTQTWLTTTIGGIEEEFVNHLIDHSFKRQVAKFTFLKKSAGRWVTDFLEELEADHLHEHVRQRLQQSVMKWFDTLMDNLEGMLDELTKKIQAR